jgi:hypothetical protein
LELVQQQNRCGVLAKEYERGRTSFGLSAFPQAILFASLVYSAYAGIANEFGYEFRYSFRLLAGR